MLISSEKVLLIFSLDSFRDLDISRTPYTEIPNAAIVIKYCAKLSTKLKIPIVLKPRTLLVYGITVIGNNNWLINSKN